MHTSWLVTLSRRIARHESSFVRRWGVQQLLTLDLQALPLLEQCGHGFLARDLVAMLTDASLYHK